MTTETITVHDFIAAEGLTMEAELLDKDPRPNPDEWGKTASHWMVTIRKDGGSLTTPYSIGSAHRVWKKSIRGAWGGKCPELPECPKAGARVRIPYRPTLRMEGLVRDHSEPMRPDLASVLDCLASDASGYENARSFEEWASDYGYDADSRRAEAMYRACGDTAKDLRHLLGLKAYGTLLYNCERL